jgi:SNF2 family DNA or RNA helicase
MRNEPFTKPTKGELRDYLEGKIKDEILRASIHVLRGLTQLRQICNDPRLLKAEHLQGGGSAKIEALMEQIDSKSAQHKILVFSQFVSMLDLLRKSWTGAAFSYAYLNRRHAQPRRGRSSFRTIRR